MACEECCIGRGVAAVRHRSRQASYTYYSMCFLKEDFAHFEAEGTVFGCINKTSFEKINVVVPPAVLVIAFGHVVGSIDEAIENQSLQTQTLASLRDTLLPKLLSGEIRVTVAEIMVEEVL